MKTTFAVLALLGTVVTIGVATQDGQGRPLSLTALSTDAALVTGGNVLVQIALPSGAQPASLKVTAGGRDVTSDILRFYKDKQVTAEELETLARQQGN